MKFGPGEVNEYNHWLGQRIREIMDEKGKAFSVRSLYKKIGCKNHMELQRYLDGTKVISKSTLTRIADALKMESSRILQTDTEEKCEELKSLLAAGTDQTKALQIAKCLSYIALGTTERYDAIRSLGQAYYNVEQYDEALEVWQGLYQELIKKKRKGIDKERVYKVINDIANAYFAVKQYSLLNTFLQQSEPLFRDDPERIGRFKHFQGLCAFYKGFSGKAMEFYRESLEYYKRANSDRLVGRIEHNIADLLFQQKKYDECKSLLLSAKHKLVTDTLEMNVILDKNLARVLVCLGEISSAREIIMNRIEALQGTEFETYHTDLVAKLLLIKVDIDGDFETAKRVIMKAGISQEVRCNLADMLLLYYICVGDTENSLKYYEILKDNVTKFGVANYKSGEWF